MKTLRVGLATVSVAAAFVGFVLPWARLDIGTGALEKQIGARVRAAAGRTFQARKARAPAPARRGAKPAVYIPSQISGAEIPRYADSDKVKVLLGLAEMVTGRREPIGALSWAVYLLPGLAMLLGLLIGGQAAGGRWVSLLVALACGGAGYAAWTLGHIDTRKQFAIVIGPGIWTTLAAYAGLGVAGVIGMTGRQSQQPKGET